MPRFLKYYVAIAAIASLLSVSMGIYMSFHGTNQTIYCDFEVEKDRANFVTANGSCRLRIGMFLSVFGRIFLVLMFAFCAPVLLYAHMRRGYRCQSFVRELRRRLDPHLVPWLVRPPEGGDEPTCKPRDLTSWVNQQAGPFFVGYFVVTATAVFLLGSFITWANLDFNRGMDYCSARGWPGAFDFYIGGEHCQIQYFFIFFQAGILIFIITLILNIPAILYFIFRYLLMWKNYLWYSGAH